MGIDILALHNLADTSRQEDYSYGFWKYHAKCDRKFNQPPAGIQFHKQF